MVKENNAGLIIETKEYFLDQIDVLKFKEGFVFRPIQTIMNPPLSKDKIEYFIAGKEARYAKFVFENVTITPSEIQNTAMFYNNLVTSLTENEKNEWKKGNYRVDKDFYPEQSDIEILTECVKIRQTSKEVKILTEDNHFTFPKYKEAIKKKFDIDVEEL